VLLSQESEYGLEGLAVLAQHPRGTVMLLDRIARARRLPVSFLARIFQEFRRHDLVTSHRGAVRGYALARPARAIRLLDVFEAIEGPHFLDRCIFRSRRCDERGPCSLHGRWVGLARTLQRALAQTTLEEVARDLVPRREAVARLAGPRTPKPSGTR
jgi:Rrf2 family protein